MSASVFDIVFPFAHAVYSRFDRSGGQITYTFVPTALPAAEVWALLEGSSFAPILLPEGTLLNQPEEPYYAPIQPIWCRSADLTKAEVIVSCWDPPGWAAELVIGVRYGDELWGAQRLRLMARARQPSWLALVLVDSQKAATGYEGEHRSVQEPTPDQAAEFVDLIRRICVSKEARA